MLTLQLIPYHETQQLNRTEKIDRILEVVGENKIALLEGKIESQEESELIKKTMESIGEHFKGIEVASLSGIYEDSSFITKLRYRISGALLGNKVGLTIIGPANIIAEIKQDPKKMQLLLSDKRRKKKR